MKRQHDDKTGGSARRAQRRIGFCRFFFTICLSLILFFSNLCPAAAAGKTVSAVGKGDDTPHDFVLLLDCSGTMSQNDKERWTASATEQFVDILPEDSNIRLSVIAFGPSYGSKACNVGSQDKQSAGRVAEVFTLQSLTDSSREEAKNAIDTETGKSGEWTPIGYALEAACNTLQNNDAVDGRAAIILLSDGKVEGQTDYTDKKTRTDYKSIAGAKQTAAEHSWPIYALELNYSGKSEGKHTMREVLPDTYGSFTTDAYEIEDAASALRKLVEIFSAIYPGSPIDPNVTDQFTVDEMTAEETLAFSGDVSKISKIVLTSPSGETEEYPYQEGETDTDNRKVSFSSNAATIKMIMPEEGTWGVHTEGDTNLSLQTTAISFKEMNLVLSVEGAADGDTLDAGVEIPMSAWFEYNGTKYESDTFYKNNPAVLDVNGKQSTMTGDTDGYTGSYVFTDKGSYVVKASVASSLFRDGERTSGTFSFNVDNYVTQPVGEIPELSCHIGESTDAIDLSQYFEDDDALTYSLVKQNSFDDYDYKIEGSMLTLTSGAGSKVYTGKITANDGSGEADAVQEFTFTVMNQPVQLIDTDYLKPELMQNGDAYTITYTDYFTDPDGAAPDVRLFYDEETDDAEEAAAARAEILDIDDSGENELIITPKKAGTVSFELLAIDGNTDSVAQVMLVDVTVLSPMQNVMKHFGWLIALLVVILIGVLVFVVLLLTGKEIYGVWDVDATGDMPLEGITLGKYKACKKSSVPVNKVLIALGFNAECPKAVMTVGNRFNKKVFFTDLQAMESVSVDDQDAEGFKDKKFKQEVKVGQSIRLTYGGTSIVFTRTKM